ncbi:hypothetical protein L1987_02135 [Smallanthus sonchifolius]|uniref:Uncharacterized protein n=1 Tax=Smallanthus sonchifolius TaxID=185202 RepID=A0ACB9K757_9ASTR|nr:hypothetical protein L1987_02135 [Smallanthus sonchifolius]
MKLRSLSSDPSDKGKSIVELSDNEDADNLVSDSDYSESSHEGIDNDEEVKLIDVSDFEVDEPKRRKTGSWKGKRKVKERENQSDEETEIAVEHVKLDKEDDVVVKKRPKKKEKKTKPILMWEVWEEENEKWLDQHMTVDIDLDNLNEIVAETVDPSPDLIMPLLRYQKEWLAWGLRQEESASRGGILADEMGMGKTVQAIALVLAKRALFRELGELAELSTGSSTGLSCVKTTLVICPLIAVMQWVNEIDRFTTKGSNKVLVYHGPNRGKTLFEFSEYDFIITTYSIVEAEYRKNVMRPKERCQWCGKMFYPNKMKIHLKYFCGPDAVKTVRQAKQNKKKGKLGEKVSLSKVDLSDEEDDKKKSSKRNTKGKRKKENLDTCDFPDGSSGSGYKSSSKSLLHSVKWNRIILDEAHYIKDRRCNTTRAVFALESSYKWALSGTPLQNRVGELYSLVRFLQITPYSYYMCKDCDCKVLDYSSNSSCPGCPHKTVRHFCWWNKYIANPIANRGRSDDGRRAMILLKDKVLKSILLRRTKKGRAADLALPPRIISLRRDYLDFKEQDYYTSLYSESQAQFNTYIEEGTLMNNYAHIFDLLTRLRQAVDHPYLVVYSKSAVARRSENKSSDEQFCGICHDVAEDPVVTSCEHLFCKSCLIGFSASYGEPACPSCSKPLTVDFSANNNDQEVQKPKSSYKGFKSSSIINRIRLENFQTSTKIDALKEEIRFMVERDGSAKGIVFSQFTSFLDLIHYSLQKCGVKCVQLDGSMTMAAREAAITRFTNDCDCKVFLMSLKAGGVALNLTVASHVFLMDPWWNPAVEQQAQDRIHRIGQYKPIRVVRFVIENTIEERILNLQEKKKLVFEGTVGGSNEALGRLTEADMRFLFAT